MLKPGWLDRQFDRALEDIKSWPEWMRREAGLEDLAETEKRDTPAKKEENKKALKMNAKD